jgi:hypothetical protein
MTDQPTDRTRAEPAFELQQRRSALKSPCQRFVVDYAADEIALSLQHVVCVMEILTRQTLQRRTVYVGFLQQGRLTRPLLTEWNRFCSNELILPTPFRFFWS